MKKFTDTFDYTVPKTHPEAGTVFPELPFSYDQCETEDEARAVMLKRNLTVLDVVNKILKGVARSNAYQKFGLAYKPSEVAPDDIKERMIRDYIRLGISEDAARKQVDALLAASQAGNE